LLKNAYETHLINTFRYGLVYKGQDPKYSAIWRIKVNLIETAGNLPRMLFVLAEGIKAQVTQLFMKFLKSVLPVP
jgi:hypothetical protein